MIKKSLLVVAMLVAVLLPGILPALAASSTVRHTSLDLGHQAGYNGASVLMSTTSITVYVDLGRQGANEDGTVLNPYDTAKEGEAYAATLLTGAWLEITDVDGNKLNPKFVPHVNIPVTGVPLPRLTLYTLLAGLALALILAGWWLRRRAVKT